MSLRWRIMASTVFVVVLTVLTSVAVGYYATQSRLGVFVDEIGSEEAVQLARDLSREYTASGGWETVDKALSEAGYDGTPQREQSRERSEEGEEEHSESSHQDRVRVVIVGADGRVVKDNLSELLPGAIAPNLDGHRETILDLSSNRPVGHVYVDVNRDLLSSESHGFLSTLLYITAIGGTLTVAVAILLALWLSRRITAPVTALTEATQAIAQGDATRLPVTSEDELGRMSEAFNRMTSALETQRELRRRLINDVSHELNTPLSVIKLEAKGLHDGLQTPESASDHIIQEVDRLSGIVTDLDWLAETDHGGMRLTRESVSIRDLLTAEAERWQPQAQARQVGLSLELPGDLPDVVLDRMRMSQALGNVISNAINCTEPGGSIVIRAGLDGGEALSVSVTDDGIGIDAADLPHVFERFYRTDQARSHGVGGTGLGLAIVRAIVEAHGGTIAIASDGLGQGVTVAIRLPLSVRA
ncbi:MAG: ATP-binding protein [Chloroflexota bacterium]|nr:ATP-binding protein [Chloroflexota bacterium]MDE2940821.1 ATP-binding protein [Chloroflexota bacterium]MDE3267589.1 ATP-binding protein [Chloroflexota bacterium]